MARSRRPELEAAVARARTIAREVLLPNARQVDREGSFPLDSMEAVRTAGLLGLLVSREYGGLESDPRTYCEVFMELGKACPSTAMIFAMHCGVVRNVELYAGEATKRRFLPPMTSGELLVCSARNEPTASATQGYVGSLRESLTPQPAGGYRFTTTKFFASGSTGADYICALGRVVSAPPGRDELWVLVPRTDPGVEIVEDWDTLGMRGTRSNYVHFRDCWVEPDASLGEPTKDRFGDYAILGQAIVAVAVAEAAFEFGVRYLRGEAGESSGLDLTKDANAQRELGELELLLEAARWLFHQACLAIETGDEQISTPAIQRAWYYSKVVGADVPHRVLQVVGGRGTYRRLDLERIVRDGETISLMGPTRHAVATGVGRARLGDGPHFRSMWLD
jgi:alkylation response protein AidB-like acyl-CoA dehydrogenase